MMMPANYSAIAENEMTYVVGGGLVDRLAPVMTDAEWQKVNTNLITLVGNHFLGGFLNNTLGVIFNGTYQPGQVATNLWKTNVTGVWKKNYNGEHDTFWDGAKGVLNVALQGVGALASIYTLGQGSVGLNVKEFKDTQAL